MFEAETLVTAMLAMRYVAMVLAVAMLVSWGPSWLRVVRARASGQDAQRAIWTTLAGAVLLFQAGWLIPGLEGTPRLRVWFPANVMIVATLLAAIYHHGREREHFDVRRTILAHAAIVVIAVAFAAAMR